MARRQHRVEPVSGHCAGRAGADGARRDAPDADHARVRRGPGAGRRLLARHQRPPLSASPVPCRIFKGLRAPSRASILFLLCLAVLAARAAAAIFARVPASKQTLCATAIAALILVEYWSAPMRLISYPRRALLYDVPGQAPGRQRARAARSPPRHAALPRRPLSLHARPSTGRRWSTATAGTTRRSYIERLVRLRTFPSASAINQMRADKVRYVVVHEDRYLDPAEGVAYGRGTRPARGKTARTDGRRVVSGDADRRGTGDGSALRPRIRGPWSVVRSPCGPAGLRLRLAIGPGLRTPRTADQRTRGPADLLGFATFQRIFSCAGFRRARMKRFGFVQPPHATLAILTLSTCIVSAQGGQTPPPAAPAAPAAGTRQPGPGRRRCRSSSPARRSARAETSAGWPAPTRTARRWRPRPAPATASGGPI